MDENEITIVEVSTEDGDWYEVLVIQGDKIIERVEGNHSVWPRTYAEAIFRTGATAWQEYEVGGGEAGWDAWITQIADGVWVEPEEPTE